MTNQKHLVLGAFFVIVLSILGYYTLFLTDFALFGERHELEVFFTGANGLRQGDSVLVAGIRQGRVGTLEYDPTAEREQRIRVQLVMDAEVTLREGFLIEIQDATLLGGKLVYIDPGPASGGPLSEGPLFGKLAHNPLESIGEFIAENREAVKNMVANVDEVVADVRAGKGLVGRLIYDEVLATDVSDGLQSASATFKNAEEITGAIRNGEGVLGRLVTDEDLALKLQEIGDNLATITADLKEVSTGVKDGKGVLGKLVNDEELATDVAEAVATVREIADRINRGEGTLGRLVADDELADRVQSILTKIDEGEGTLGLLISNDEIYVKLNQTADDLAAASAALSNAEGTLGKLLMDDTLYNQLKSALDVVTQSLEEFREAAPITTFTSVLFGAF